MTPALPEDGETPFSPADDSIDDMADPDIENRRSRRLDPTHQSLDGNIQPEELYDEGYSGAAEIDLPHKSAVISYDPSQAKTSQTKKP